MRQWTDLQDKKHILLVEEYPGLAEVLEYLLSSEGYRVTCVATAEAALASAELDPPDLVVTELWLPDFDGLEFCRRLQPDGDAGKIPVLVMTDTKDREHQLTASALGIAKLFIKPFSMSDFIKRIDKVLLNANALSQAKPSRETGIAKSTIPVC